MNLARSSIALSHLRPQLLRMALRCIGGRGGWDSGSDGMGFGRSEELLRKQRQKIERLKNEMTIAELHYELIKEHQEAIRRHREYLETVSRRAASRTSEEDYDTIVEYYQVTVCCAPEIVVCCVEDEDDVKRRMQNIHQREVQLWQSFREKRIQREEFHRTFISIHEEAIETYKYLADKSRNTRK